MLRGLRSSSSLQACWPCSNPSDRSALVSCVDRRLPSQFASATIGYRRFAWERAKHPEMYRWNCLFKYVPLAMLERLRTVFKKGGI